MRRVLGYVDGKPQWSDNEPAYGGSSKLGGSLVVGGPGSHELGILAARRNNAKKKAEKAERRSYARCDTWMPVAEAPCGLRRNHRHDHRSTFALALRRKALRIGPRQAPSPLARARATWDNAVVGVSDVLDSATMRDGAASGAYSTGGRVAASTRGVRP
jgi:hypothetical protein